MHISDYGGFIIAFNMISRYKNITPSEKLHQSIKLYFLAKELKKSSLKKFYPQLSSEEIEIKLKAVFGNARN